MDNIQSDRTGTIQIGCAGWSLPKEYANHFPRVGTHLARYSARFTAVEINSTFYRPHRPTTYARWAESVPEEFLFSVKMPKEVTHERRLVDVSNSLDRFRKEVTQLGEKLGPILVQLPPSLSFSAEIAEEFFVALRNRFAGGIAFEPRHSSWFKPSVNHLLERFRISRVAADPARTAFGSTPTGWGGLVYYRLHGNPKIYYSSYTGEYLETLSEKLLVAAQSAAVWCIFDNTAEGEATANALDLLRLLSTS